MGKYNGAVITTAGHNVISQAISGTELTWLTMKTSSTAIPAETNIEALTSLSGIEQTSNITDASVYGNDVIQLSARFSNTNIATEYYIQTVGIYGQLAGGSETLIAVMTAVTPDEMPVYDPDAPSAFIFNAQITVQNAASVTMTVNDTGTASVADLNRKLDKTGDASDANIGSSTASTASYPIPAANDTFKVILGKIIKFFTDIKAAYTNVSINGKNITFTTADGGTKQITTQDTTYSDFTQATASTAGTHGLVPAPAAGKQGQFLRGDATWATPANTTYSPGTGLALSGTTFNHTNAVTSGTAGTPSATAGYDTFAVPYVTYDAQGHVTAAGTHTHTVRTFNPASETANGNPGLVPAPLVQNYPDRALIFLHQAGWGYLPLQNNATTTAEHYALDARMGKALNDRITTYTNVLGFIYVCTPPYVITVATSGLTNIMNTDVLPVGRFIFTVQVELGAVSDSSTLLTRVMLYREANQQALVDVHPFTKNYSFAFPYTSSTTSRFIVRVTANKAADITGDGARCYLRVMQISP